MCWSSSRWHNVGYLHNGKFPRINTTAKEDDQLKFCACSKRSSIPIGPISIYSERCTDVTFNINHEDSTRRERWANTQFEWQGILYRRDGSLDKAEKVDRCVLPAPSLECLFGDINLLFQRQIWSLVTAAWKCSFRSVTSTMIAGLVTLKSCCYALREQPHRQRT